MSGENGEKWPVSGKFGVNSLMKGHSTKCEQFRGTKGQNGVLAD
jgi:hypothetical protein